MTDEHRAPLDQSSPFGPGPWRVTDVYSFGPLGEQWACLRDGSGNIVAQMSWPQAVEVQRLLTEAKYSKATPEDGGHPMNCYCEDCSR